MTYKSVLIKPDVFDLIADCETIYRKHHPELNNIPLSKNKILYEVFKFYLLKTPLEVREK